MVATTFLSVTLHSVALPRLMRENGTLPQAYAKGYFLLPFQGWGADKHIKSLCSLCLLCVFVFSKEFMTFHL